MALRRRPEAPLMPTISAFYGILIQPSGATTGRLISMRSTLSMRR
jgi:hypothetical protein